MIIEVSEEPIMAWYPDGKIVVWNCGAELFYGWTRAEAEGKIIHELLRTFHPVSLAHVHAQLRRDGRWIGELTHTTRDGQQVVVESRQQLVVEPDGSELVIETNRDISERLRAQESQARAAAIIQSSSDAIIGKDLNGRITSWNESAERIFGYSESEAVGQPVLMLIPAELQHEEAQILARIRAGERIDHYETVRLRKDGARVQVALTISPIRDRLGKIVGASKIARDIGEKRRVEEALRKSEEVFRLNFEQTSVGMAHVSLDGRFLRVNDRLCAITGYSREELLTKTFLDLTHPADRNVHVVQMNDMLAGRIPRLTLEKRYIHKQGHDVWVSVTGSVLRDEDGSPLHLLSVFEDISERKRAEEQLRQQRERFEFAIESAELGYWFWDLPANRLVWDERVKEHFWLSPKTDLSIDLFYALLHPDDLAPTRAAIEEAIATRTRYDVEYRTLSPDGQIKWIRAIGSAAYDPAGTAVRFDGITQDITAKKQGEEALRKSEKLALVGRLAATISHEINNPLEAIANLLFLIEGETSGQVRDYVRTAQEELTRVSHIATHTLRFNRQSTVRKEEQLPALLDSAVAIYDGRVRQSSITVVREYRDSPSIACFGSELRQVFANLIGNAFDASRSGDKIILRVREARGRSTGESGVRVTIADTGSGMDATTVKRLFEPFFTTKGTNGTGLGLWVSREILEKHNALVRVRSSQTPGQSGTVFSLWFPLSATSA